MRDTERFKESRFSHFCLVPEVLVPRFGLHFLIRTVIQEAPHHALYAKQTVIETQREPTTRHQYRRDKPLYGGASLVAR